MMKFLKLLILCGCFSLLADETGTEVISFGKLPTPWFTGPLIAPSGFTAPPGDFTLQPYFDSFVKVGFYDSHGKAQSTPNFYNINTRVRFKAGITHWMDAQILSQAFYRETRGVSSTGFGDIVFGINFQLLTYEIQDSWPAIKLHFTASVPSGKYQKLDPHRLFTDAMGSGSWFPEAALVLSKLWHLSGIHYLEARFFSGCRFGTPASVRGLNVYGGDPSTRGVVYPGNHLFAAAAIQSNFTQNWAFACDFLYQHQDRTRFSGQTDIPSVLPSSDIFSLAPAIEYNFKKTLGLIGGIWFSFAGRNGPEFINGILSLNSYF